jgi:hypothetical protein
MPVPKMVKNGLNSSFVIFHPQHGQDLTAKQARIGPEQAKQE